MNQPAHILNAHNVAVRANIQTIAGLEKRFLESLSRADRLTDAVARLAGSLKFVIFHLAWFSAWVWINVGGIRGIRPFDPYPFVLLALCVSCEAVLLSMFVLMKQNRESRRSDARDHLNLQIDLLAEQEITRVLQMQIDICKHFGITTVASHPTVQELSRETVVESVADELREKLTQNPEEP